MIVRSAFAPMIALLVLGACTGSGASPVDGGAQDAAADAAPPNPDGGGGLFANCSLAGGCIADCSPPANDPIATGNPAFDLYDGCFLAGMQLAGMTEAWQGQLLKSQAYNESGISPLITTNDATCGGQNCGIWAISAGAASGDSAPGAVWLLRDGSLHRTSGLLA